MKDWSKKRNDKIFALSACVDVFVVGKNGKDYRENRGTERLRSHVNRNKNRYAIVPFPCEQSLFAFQNLACEKLERRWNGTIAFPCERGIKGAASRNVNKLLRIFDSLYHRDFPQLFSKYRC